MKSRNQVEIWQYFWKEVLRAVLVKPAVKNSISLLSLLDIFTKVVVKRGKEDLLCNFFLSSLLIWKKKLSCLDKGTTYQWRWVEKGTPGESDTKNSQIYKSKLLRFLSVHSWVSLESFPFFLVWVPLVPPFGLLWVTCP